MILDSKRVHEMMLDCLFKPNEIADGKPIGSFTDVAGITQRFGLHPERLASHKEELKKMIQELPDPFLKSKGGGWSFLNLCMDKHERQWAEHPTMQEFCVLCIGNGLAEWCMPREMWDVLPGGMPYVVFDSAGVH